MSADNEKENLKRSATEDTAETEKSAESEQSANQETEAEGEDDAWIGPMPSEQSTAVPAKKKKGKQA